MTSFRIKQKSAAAFESYASTISENMSSVSFRKQEAAPKEAFKSYFSTIMQPKAEKTEIASLLGKFNAFSRQIDFSHKIEQSLQPEVGNSVVAAPTA